jgi:hypothetical protein
MAAQHDTRSKDDEEKKMWVRQDSQPEGSWLRIPAKARCGICEQVTLRSTARVAIISRIACGTPNLSKKKNNNKMLVEVFIHFCPGLLEWPFSTYFEQIWSIYIISWLKLSLFRPSCGFLLSCDLSWPVLTNTGRTQ